MKKLGLIFCFIVSFGLCEFAWSQEQTTLEWYEEMKAMSQEERYKKSDQRNLTYYYLASLIATKTHIPPRYFFSHHSIRYRNFLYEKYPYLEGVMKENTNYRLYDISKFSKRPKVYFGSPPYLWLSRYNSSKKPEIKPLDVTVAIEKPIFSTFFDLTENEDNAEVFIMPVGAYDSLMISHPEIITRPSLDIRQKYATLFTDLSHIFFNMDYMTLNDRGLRGAILKNEKGDILQVFCPIDVESSASEIEADIFYCLVQSMGLPGFYAAFPRYTPRTIGFAKLMLNFHSCDAIKPQQNYFELPFDDTFFEECISPEEYEAYKKASNTYDKKDKAD